MSAANTSLFLLCAAFALMGALGTVLSRRPLRAAVALLVHIIALAGLYLTLHAQLLAALQLLVYAGAVVVLFVFVIMMIGPYNDPMAEAGAPPDRGLIPRAISLIMGVVVITATSSALVNFTAPFLTPLGASYGTVEGLGGAIYLDGMVPFELVSVTLLVAIVGAIAVARGRSKAEANAAKAAQAERDAIKAARTEHERRLAAEVSAHGGH